LGLSRIDFEPEFPASALNKRLGVPASLKDASRGAQAREAQARQGAAPREGRSLKTRARLKRNTQAQDAERKRDSAQPQEKAVYQSDLGCAVANASLKRRSRK